MAILRIDGVLTSTGNKSHATIYDRIKRGLFPRPVPIGARSVGWPDYEVEAINAAHIAGADDDTMRALVERLHAKRTEKLALLLAA
jgi:prophage regulatory protein